MSLEIPTDVEPRFDSVQIDVEYAGDTVYSRSFDRSHDVRRLPVVPGNAEPTSRFRVEASLLSSGVPIAVQRAEVAFQPGSKRTIRLVFEEGCTCVRAPWQACVAGGCVDACVGRDGSLESCSCDPPIAISAGRDATCAIWNRNDNQSLWCWGEQPVGSGSGEMRLVPVASPVDVVCSAWGRFCCVVDVQGDVSCFGNAEDGRLGTSTPVVTGENVHTLALGVAHGCALGDSLWCWGANEAGQVDPEAGRVAPSQRITLDGVRDIAAGGSHTCALVNDSVTCWGRDEYDELGGGVR